MISFWDYKYFLENYQPFEGLSNNKSPQGTGVDVKEFTVNSNTNNSHMEESPLFGKNRTAEGERSLSLVK